MNKKVLAIGVVLLFFLGGMYMGSQFFGKQKSVAIKTQGSSKSNVTTSMHHNEGTYMVPENSPAPSVKVFLEKDTKAGYNLHIETQNFTFTPENVNKENVMNEGHAHIFINGEKVGRLYGNWYHIKSLPMGKVYVTVNLTANNHATYVVNGVEIADTVTVSVPPPAEPTMHEE